MDLIHRLLKFPQMQTQTLKIFRSISELKIITRKMCRVAKQARKLMQFQKYRQINLRLIFLSENKYAIRLPLTLDRYLFQRTHRGSLKSDQYLWDLGKIKNISNNKFSHHLGLQERR